MLGAAESLRPDREKLLSIAAAVEFIEVPAVSIDVEDEALAVREILFDAVAAIRAIVEKMR